MHWNSWCVPLTTKERKLHPTWTPVNIYIIRKYKWRIQDFPCGGFQLVSNLLFGRMLAENYIKTKEIGLRVHIPSDPWIHQWILIQFIQHWLVVYEIFFLFSNVYMYKVALNLVTKWFCKTYFISNDILIMLRHCKLMMSGTETFSKHNVEQNEWEYVGST